MLYLIAILDYHQIIPILMVIFKINNLHKLKNNYYIENKIFSFGQWDLMNESVIKSYFYLGDTHDIFRSNYEIIGSCNSNDSFWGCEFNEIIFKDISLPLKNEEGNLYQIHFALETHNIIFPMRYIEIFENITHKFCQVNHYNYLDCINMFNNNDYIPIKLSNEYMTITGEIDNINRFTIKNKDRSNLTRITFEDIDYFVFPLIMFKNFHIQFDGEQNIISFYTNDSTILKIKKIVNKNEGESSSILIIIIVIVIILIALFIGFIVYRFIKKRRGLNAEEEINNLHEIINTKNN
jgi:hypothetical protein